MAILFKNPVLQKLEDMLLEKAKQRYIDEGGDPIDDLKKAPKDVKNLIKGWVDAWASDERRKIDMAWPEFGRVVKDKTQDSLTRLLEKSSRDMYSIELVDGIYPIILAVPYEVLYFWTEKLLPKLFAEKIQFKDMMTESLESLSSFAVKKFFEAVLHDVMRKQIEFKIDKAFRPVLFVDVIEKDFYHVGEAEEVSRVKMVIISTFDDGFRRDKKKWEKAKKESVQFWKKYKSQTDNGRPDGRRFTGQGWNLPVGFLENIVLE